MEARTALAISVADILVETEWPLRPLADLDDLPSVLCYLRPQLRNGQTS